MARFESVLDSVGGTPLIRLTRAVAGLRPRIYVKAEWQNPGGGVKDRAALWMLRQAEADGSLRPGGTVVEATSGNTGIGLALIAAHLGYRAVIFAGSRISAEKQAQITAYGAELRLVDAFVPRDHPDSLRSHAQRYAEQTPGAWLAGQYDNPANPASHAATTGPEIWDDTDGTVTHLVACVGTGGTISGAGRYLKTAGAGRVRVIGADPITSSYSGGDGSLKYIEGAGHFVHPDTVHDLWPRALDGGVIDEYVGIGDRLAIDTVRQLARTEGILAGGSSGVALAAALQVAGRLDENHTVVVLLPDSGRSYLSTYFNDRWLAVNGFTDPEPGTPTVGEVAGPVTAVEEGFSRAELPNVNSVDDVLLLAHRRPARTLAPHPSDIIGWTTARRLRDPAWSVAAAGPVGVALGAGLAVTDPAVQAWALCSSTRDDVALVLTDGRVTGALTRDTLTRATSQVVAQPAAQPGSRPGVRATASAPARPAAAASAHRPSRTKV
ncbi:cysteine synthase family protein [Kineosporia sp. J2-2]|uniref:Cysteine synthase family protein n=1 Tax=Kineosporia corallincola TaxID=2835133 RepID=A0ABS5TAS1_9ACTN|nr:cysteine synthase family protein [Kineosporia corallincola]MBT0768169.1 cysteine synthase family protein [Kineosporia corallincola]